MAHQLVNAPKAAESRTSIEVAEEVAALLEGAHPTWAWILATAAPRWGGWRCGVPGVDVGVCCMILDSHSAEILLRPGEILGLLTGEWLLTEEFIQLLHFSEWLPMSRGSAIVYGCCS